MVPPLSQLLVEYATSLDANLLLDATLSFSKHSFGEISNLRLVPLIDHGIVDLQSMYQNRMMTLGSSSVCDE